MEGTVAGTGMGDRSSGDRVAVDWGRSSLSEDQEANLEFFSFRNGNPFFTK